jgi:polyisoprenoid-binding protein YceI
MRRFARSVIAIVAVSFPQVAAASRWQIDPAHTSAQFAVRHLMISTVRGTFSKVTGAVNLDESDLAKSSVHASIDVASIDTREPKRDAHLKGPDFFDAAAYPAITFTSKNVAKLSETKFQITGDLTMRGVTKEVVLNVEGAPTPATDPMGNRRIGGVATTKLNRRDFGIQWNKIMDGGGVVIGDDVDVTIDVELVEVK